MDEVSVDSCYFSFFLFLFSGATITHSWFSDSFSGACFDYFSTGTAVLFSCGAMVVSSVLLTAQFSTINQKRKVYQFFD